MEYKKKKFKFDFETMQEYDAPEILGRIETISDYANAVPEPDAEVVLAMLRIEKEMA